MKQKISIFFLVLILGFVSAVHYVNAQTSVEVRSCPKGSAATGCFKGILAPEYYLVLAGVSADFSADSISLTPSSGAGQSYVLGINLTRSGSQYYVKSSGPLDKDLSGQYDINSVTGNKVTKLLGGISVQKAPTSGSNTTEDNTDTGGGQTGSGGTNTGGQNPTGGGTTGTGGGKQVASGDGKIRDGLEAIKGEFNTTGDIAGATSIGGLIVGVIRFLLALLLALAVLMIIIGGFIYLTSAGNEDKAKNGRKTVMYAIYGLIIVILSYTLVNVVERAISTGDPDK